MDEKVLKTINSLKQNKLGANYFVSSREAVDY